MTSRSKVGIVALGFLVLGGLAFVAKAYFAPQPTIRVDEASASDGVPLKQGTFAGADAVHEVTGTVSWHDGILHFSDYEATSGPDVFFYLAGDGEFAEAAALRLPVPRGEGAGQATLRGSFDVPTPAAADPAVHTRLVVWCKRFGVQFGAAELAP